MTFKLAIVTGSLSPAAGGLFESVRLPAIAMNQRGIEVSVYGHRDALFAANAEAWASVPIHAFPVIGPSRFGYSPAMRSAIMDADVDVLHQHGIWFAPSAFTDAWRRRSGRPTVIAPRGMLDSWAISKSRSTKLLLGALYENRNLRHAAVLHALNLSEARSFRELGFTNPIALIPNGIHLVETRPPLAVPDWMEGDGRKVLLFLARIHPKKGISELISAWGLALERMPTLRDDWRVVVAGWDDGGHLSALKSQVEYAHLSNDVSFTGPLYAEHKTSAFAHASAFILPSYSEGLPMSVLEAWNWSLPVFMTRACNLPEGFSAEAAVEVSTDPVDMADVLVQSLGSADALLDMGQNGRRLVEQRYTWGRIVGDMKALYAWLIRGGDTPAFVIERGCPVCDMTPVVEL